MSIQLIYHTFEVIGIVNCLLLIIGVLRTNPGNRSARLLALLALCGVCYLIRTRQEYGFFIPEVMQFSSTPFDLLLDVIMNSFSGVFMLFIFSLFREGERFPRWLLGLFAVQMLLEPFSHLLSQDAIPGLVAILNTTTAEFAFDTVPRFMQLVFVLVSIFWTVRDWRTDLVARRRTYRLLILAYMGITNFINAAAYSFIVPQNDYFAFQFHVFSVAIVVSIPFLIVLLNFRFDLAVESEPVSVPLDTPPPSKLEENWRDFEQRFEQEQLYREPGLDIKSLARSFSLPEYRLRRLIHEGLGYRNFNAFLHHYRVRDACVLFEDPENSQLPILTIALTVGYQSINPFNRAFRELKEMTPTEYRAQLQSSN